MQFKQRLLGVVLVIISAASFGIMPVFARLAYLSGATPTSLLFLRFAGAACCMLAWMLVRKKPFPRGKTLLALFLTGFVGYASLALSYFTAITLAPAGLVIILVYLYPVIVTGASFLFFRHPITRLDGLALLLALAGTALLIGMELGGRPLGIVLGLLAAFINAGYVMVSTKLTQHTQAFASSTVIIAAASLAYGSLMLWQGVHFPTTLMGWGAVGALAMFSTVLAIFTFLAGLKRIGPVKASMLSTLEPVVTVIFAIMFLGESLTLSKMIGGGMVLTTAVLLTHNEMAIPDK